MLAYIPAPWILWEYNPNSRSKHSEIRWMTCWHRFRVTFGTSQACALHRARSTLLHFRGGTCVKTAGRWDGLGFIPPSWKGFPKWVKDRFASTNGGSIAGSLIMEHPSLKWIIWGSPQDTPIMAVFSPIMAGGPMGKCTMSQGTCGSTHTSARQDGTGGFGRDL